MGIQQGYIQEEGSRKDGQGNIAGIYLGSRKQEGWIGEYSMDIFRKQKVGRMDRGIQQGYIQEEGSRKNGQGNIAGIYLGRRKQEGWIGEYSRDIFRKKKVGRMDRGIQKGYIQEVGSRKDGQGNIAGIYLGRRKQEGWIGEYRRDIFRKQEVGRMDRGVQQGYILEEGSRKDGQGNTAGIYLESRKQEGWIGEYSRNIFRKYNKQDELIEQYSMDIFRNQEVGRINREIQHGYIQKE